MITINRPKEDEPECYLAADMEEGDLFYDSDGDLHFRLCNGSLMLTENGEELRMPIFFSEKDLEDTSVYPHFNECTVVEGEMTFTVDLKDTK